jgi:hypothetical protein
MDRIHHKPIKKFSLDGVIYDDSALWRLKIEYIKLLMSEMRLLGYVPRFDIKPDFTIDFDNKKECFNFEMSVYGIYVGKRKSEWILGVNQTEVLYTPQSKSSVYFWELA